MASASLLKARIHLFRLLPSPFTKQRRPSSCYSTAAISSSSPDPFAVNFLIDHCNLCRSFPAHHPGLFSSQIGRVVTYYPAILLSRPNRTLVPKLRFLSSFLPPTHLPDLVASSPGFLRRSLTRQIEPLFALIRRFLDSPDALLLAARRYPRLLNYKLADTATPNISFLLSRGVPSGSIAKLLCAYPRSVALPAARYAEAVRMVEALGLRPDMSMFV
ncbi:hypothetical protein BHE74_00032793 [Ensete ventricosum]|nr:hypothetical protein BHE74_00032793 [Ensete ventricosum]